MEYYRGTVGSREVQLEAVGRRSKQVSFTFINKIYKNDHDLEFVENKSHLNHLAQFHCTLPSLNIPNDGKE